MNRTQIVCIATILLFTLCFSVVASADTGEDLMDFSLWKVHDFSLAGKGQKSNWMIKDGRLFNASQVRVPNRVLFGSNIVTRKSFSDGIFRFQIEATDFRVAYGIVFRYKDEGNYYRLDFNSLCSKLVRIDENNYAEIKLPKNFCYVPARHPTWVDLVCHGSRFSVFINGIERLSFEDPTHSEGNFGFVSASEPNGFSVSKISFYPDEPPELNLKPAVLKKPYTYWCTGSEARIAWESTLPGKENIVKYGPEDKPMKQTVKAETNVLVHTAVLSNLKQGTVYKYRCFTDGVMMGEGQFRSDPGPGSPLRMGLIGDNRTLPRNFYNLNEAMMEYKPDIVLNVGDIVERGIRSDWDWGFFTPNQDVMAKVPYFVSIGNHEDNSKYFSYYLPYPDTNNKRGHYYVSRYGCIAFLAFDDYHVADEQFDWMEKTLASPMFQTAAWRVVFCHQPAYSVGWSKYDGDEWKRSGKFLKLLKKYNVHFFFNGHTHSYERGLIDGTYHILSGGGGPGGENWGRAWDPVHIFNITLQYCIFDITPERIEMVCREMDGNILDRLVVEKDKPGVLDVEPVLVQRPLDDVLKGGWPDTSSGEVVYVVKTPKLHPKKLRYKISYDRNVNTYEWTEPVPANQPIKLKISPEKSGKYTVKILGMDADGRVTRPAIHEIEYTVN